MFLFRRSRCFYFDGVEISTSQLLRRSSPLPPPFYFGVSNQFRLVSGISKGEFPPLVFFIKGIYIMTDLSLISITPNLALDIKKNEIKDKVIARLTELKLADTKYKNSSDILLLVCNLVEHLTKEKKISKKEVVLDILQVLFNLTPQEILVVEGNIEFLHSNKAIKKLSKFYLFFCGICEYFKKSKKVN